MQAMLISILRQHPNSNVNEVKDFLMRDYDKKLTHGGTKQNLLIFTREGKIVADQTKSGNVYRIAESVNQGES